MKVQCSECGKKYQLHPDEEPSDFQCTCGGELELKIEKQPPFPNKSPDKKLKNPKKSNETDKSSKPASKSSSRSSSGSILDSWKKQSLILIVVFILVFLIIAFNGTGLFKDLVVTNETAPSSGVRGNEITIDTTLTNNGILSTGGFNVTFQLTPENSSKNSIFLGKIRVSNLAGGETMQPDPTFTIPTNITSGNYYIRVIIDSNNEITESNENNNEIYSSRQIIIT